jgi:hypothetical protein
MGVFGPGGVAQWSSKNNRRSGFKTRQGVGFYDLD